MRSFAISAVAMAAPLLVSCSAAHETDATGQSRQPIHGGYADDVDHALVGLLRVAPEATFLCSGSLITPNLVLTARHCVAETPTIIACPATEFGAAAPAEELFVTTEATMPSYPSDGFHDVAQVHVPEGAPTICGRDLALLVLAEPITEVEAAPIDPSLDVATEPGKGYSAVGYGNTEPDTPGTSGDRYRRDELVVDCTGQECIPGFVWDGEWVGDEGLCSGDSGGPALDDQGRVFGIASRAGMGCDAPMYVDLFGWGEWIRATAQQAVDDADLATPEWIQPTPPPAGPDAGDAGNDGGCAMSPAAQRPTEPGGWLVLLLAGSARLLRRRRVRH